MFKVNNKNTRKLTIKTAGVFLVELEHKSHHFLVFLLLNLNK